MLYLPIVLTFILQDQKTLPTTSIIAQVPSMMMHCWCADSAVDAPEMAEQDSAPQTAGEQDNEDTQEQTQEEIASIVQKSKYAVIGGHTS